MTPKQIKIVDKDKLFIKWNDDSESMITLKYLRDECPCAACKGETVLLKTYRPLKPTATNENMFKVKDILQVGGYAIQITWKDSHNTGIYSWEYLKQLEHDQDTNNKQNYNKLI
ncbi:MAG: gamma-butyrobetaine hydroxylase-like domain-containing protein [Ignavibacteriaceae bacterium]